MGKMRIGAVFCRAAVLLLILATSSCFLFGPDDQKSPEGLWRAIITTRIGLPLTRIVRLTADGSFEWIGYEDTVQIDGQRATYSFSDGTLTLQKTEIWKGALHDWVAETGPTTMTFTVDENTLTLDHADLGGSVVFTKVQEPQILSELVGEWWDDFGNSMSLADDGTFLWTATGEVPQTQQGRWGANGNYITWVITYDGFLGSDCEYNNYCGYTLVEGTLTIDVPGPTDKVYYPWAPG